MSYKLVVFDLGGVLVKINHTWDEALAAADLHECAREPKRLLTELAPLEELQAGTISYDHFLQVLREYLGLESIEKARKTHEHIIDSPYPGTLEIIGELKEAGIKTACLSNTNEPHWREMLDTDRTPNVKALDFKLASHEMRLAKPDPAIFEECERICGADRRDILFFDDTAGHVQAAQTFGWRAELIDPLNDPARQMRAHLNLS